MIYEGRKLDNAIKDKLINRILHQQAQFVILMGIKCAQFPKHYC